MKNICAAILAASVFAGAVFADIPATTTATSGAATTASAPTDYVALLNAEYSKGVTAENNAALELLEMIGPAEKGRGAPVEIFDELKISKIGYRGRFFPLPLEYMKAHYGDDYLTKKNSEGVKAEEATRKTLWVKEDCPPIAEWLKDGAWALDTMVDALKKDRFYIPLLSSSKPPRIADTFTNRPIGRWRVMADALHARALLRWRAGEKAEAIVDLQTELKLAKAIDQEQHVISQLIGLAIERQAYVGVTLIAREGNVSEKDARVMLEAFGPTELTDLARPLSREEKLTWVENCEYAKKDTQEVAEILLTLDARVHVDRTELSIEDLAKVDWDVAAKVIGEVFDERARAAASKTYLAGKDAFGKVEERISQVSKAAEIEPLPETTDWDKVDWKKRSEESVKKLAAFLKMQKDETVDAYSRRIATQLANDRGIWLRTWKLAWLTRQQGDLARVAVAVAGYKAEKGKWPEKLEALSPGWMKEIPGDSFSGKALVYRAEKEAVIYSVGADEKDGGGVEGKSLLDGDVVVRLK